MKIRIFSILLLLILLLTACQSSGIGTFYTQAPHTDDTETLERAIEELEEQLQGMNFILGEVSVLMTNEASLKFIDYTPEYFAEIDCVFVENMKTEQRKNVQATLRGEIVDKKYDPTKYNDWLILTIKETDRAGVIRAIAILEMRDDVKRADPNYIFTMG